MLYDEFIQGTGCRETDYNYRVYKDVEEIYMNSNMTKEEAYAIGKLRVNNSLTDDEQEQIKVNTQNIVTLENRIDELKTYLYIGSWEEVLRLHKQHEQEIKELKNSIKIYKDTIIGVIL